MFSSGLFTSPVPRVVWTVAAVIFLPTGSSVDDEVEPLHGPFQVKRMRAGGEEVRACDEHVFALNAGVLVYSRNPCFTCHLADRHRHRRIIDRLGRNVYHRFSAIIGELLANLGEVHVDKKTGDVKRHVEDVNNDGLDDLVFHFDFSQTGFDCDDIPGGQQSVTLTGKLTGNLTADAGGTPIAGESDIRLAGKK